MPCEQFLQQIEISYTFLCAKQVKRGKIQFAVEIAHKAVVLILISLSHTLAQYREDIYDALPYLTDVCK